MTLARETPLKVIIWDLDETLWRGTLAEGDTVVAYPEALDLINRAERAGVIQSIASKNDASDVMPVLARLGLDGIFVYPQIGWNNKSESVATIARLLNLGPDSIVVLDDSPFERAEIEQGNPEVSCYSRSEFVSRADIQRQLAAPVSAEAAARPRLYREEAHRMQARSAFTGTPVEFLHTLDMVLTVRPASRDDLGRASELTLRTNQLNTSGKTFTADELFEYGQLDGGHLLVLELADRFGDYGRIGVCLCRDADGVRTVELLLISCRAMGRNVGTAVLAVLAKDAAARRLGLRALFTKSGRNRQMQITFGMLGFRSASALGDALTYEHDAPESIQLPGYFSYRLDETITPAEPPGAVPAGPAPLDTRRCAPAR